MESIFAILLLPIICLIVFGVHAFNNWLEHKQIMAAIEKGISLSELKPAKPAGPAWIKSLTAGIALLIIAVGIVYMRLASGNDYDYDHPPLSLIAVVLLGIGLAFFIRGLLLRKSQRKIQPSGQTEAADIKKKADISRSEG